MQLHIEILGSESFIRCLVGASGNKGYVFASSQPLSPNNFDYSRVGFKDPHHLSVSPLPNLHSYNDKATNRVTVWEPPTILNLFTSVGCCMQKLNMPYRRIYVSLH